MADWGPVVVAVILFVLLSPGLMFQVPGKTRFVEFGSMGTSGVAILVHAVLFCGLFAVLVVAVGIHVHAG
ncbi:uncharacterized protein LOC100827399 [Brachypodium distachyon]|uniref:Uncharacterized protein n=1 Tax=Brachypodium distachyon TaxID=15368 RepID=I1I9X6_BRADI|nr:uncharacterized protein LOC100827399 [Brachypodium distachyon]KQJ99583.1 hypothetical protein BRADI_3g44080v3 [Brachypodium distachyon]|eukprot:XP_003575014.1 uncharacterized protein LOC100827399 [Brachypodium distachyon]